MTNKTPTPAGFLPLTRRRFAAGAAAATGLAGLPLRRGRAQTPLKVGVLLPRSGYQGLIGQACQRGADLSPGILADLGYAVELMSADTESSVDIARTQAERLIREGAHVLTGAFDSGATAAIAQVAEQQGVPFVVNIAADPAITEQGYRYVFRNFPTAVMLVSGGLAAMNQLFETTGTVPRTAVHLHVNDNFGMAMLNGIQALLPQADVPFEVLEYIAYDPQTLDLSVEVARAKALNPDIVTVTTRLNDAILLVREMVRQRFEPMGIISPGSPGMYEAQFFETLGQYANYCVTNVPWFNEAQPLTPVLRDAFRAAYPDMLFEFNVGFTFEGILIAADAHQRAGSTDPEALTEALRATSIDQHVMTGGPIQFDEKGQNVNITSAIVQNIDGLPEIVLPAEMAAAEPVFPMPGWNERG